MLGSELETPNIVKKPGNIQEEEEKVIDDV